MTNKEIKKESGFTGGGITTRKKSEQIAELNQLIESINGRFSNYQTFPTSFINDYGAHISHKYTVNQLSLDYARLTFLSKNLDLEGLNIVEYGSNLGFFCLSIAKRFNSNVKGYEPIAQYCRSAEIIASLIGVEERVTFLNHSVKMRDINEMDESDLLIELNVLHHSGSIFDQEVMSKCGGWKSYAIERLSAMRKKSQKLFFQTGNMSNGKALFSSQESVDFVSEILRASGWSIQAIGMIANLKPDRLVYGTYTEDFMDTIPRYKCRRDAKTNTVVYKNTKSGETIHLKTGLANRPLWICE